jgi:D-mannonate dehydratase
MRPDHGHLLADDISEKPTRLLLCGRLKGQRNCVGCVQGLLYTAPELAE